MNKVPLELDADMRQMLEEANINQYLRKFVPNLLAEKRRTVFKALVNDHLNSLFDVRNKIMHMAREDRATAENCIRFIKATQTLFEIGKTYE